MNNKDSYIKTDEDIVINEKYIIWIKKLNECLEVCAKSTGCAIGNTHKICKSNNFDSYKKLIHYFE
jgi:hypothetical protein